jgi:hypothetical protein
VDAPEQHSHDGPPAPQSDDEDPGRRAHVSAPEEAERHEQGDASTLLLSTALGTFGNRGTRAYHSPTHASETTTIGCNALAASCSLGLNALHDGIAGR